MSKVSSNHPQKPGKPAAASSERFAPNKVSRPGWLEIVVGLVVMAAVAFGVGSQLRRFGLDPVVYGLVFSALSGIAGFAGFAAAVLLRIRSLSAFGVRPVSRRWLLIGVGVGLVAFVLKGLAILFWQKNKDTKKIDKEFHRSFKTAMATWVCTISEIGDYLYLSPVSKFSKFEVAYRKEQVAQSLVGYGHNKIKKEKN
jgi:hypothetical protein